MTRWEHLDPVLSRWEDLDPVRSCCRLARTIRAPSPCPDSAKNVPMVDIGGLCFRTHSFSTSHSFRSVHFFEVSSPSLRSWRHVWKKQLHAKREGQQTSQISRLLLCSTFSAEHRPRTSRKLPERRTCFLRQPSPRALFVSLRAMRRMAFGVKPDGRTLHPARNREDGHWRGTQQKNLSKKRWLTVRQKLRFHTDHSKPSADTCLRCPQTQTTSARSMTLSPIAGSWPR